MSTLSTELKNEQREQLLEGARLAPPADLNIGDDPGLMAELSARSLAAWATTADVLPVRFRQVALAAARLLEPKMQREPDGRNAENTRGRDGVVGRNGIGTARKDQERAGGGWMKLTLLHFVLCGVDISSASGQIAGTSLLFVSTTGREAGSSGSASASTQEECAEWPFGPQSGQESPTLGANCFTQKKGHPVFAGCRLNKLTGVFGAGALLPQFLAELTDTLYSLICKHCRTSAHSWQA
jgi:hypothetical protein